RQRGLDVAPGAALRQLLAEPMIARELRAARRDDVPDPGETGERQRVRTRGDAQPGHLGQASRHEAGLPVVPEAEAVGRARGNRDDVLESAAQLDAEDIPVRVQPELAPREAG